MNWQASYGTSILAQGLLGRAVREFYANSGNQYIIGITEIVAQCDQNNKVGKLITEAGYNIWDRDIISEVQASFADAKPDFYFDYLRNVKDLLNKNEYESAGIIMGDLIKSSFHFGMGSVPRLEMSNYVSGLCRTLGLNCKLDSLDCWKGKHELFFKVQAKMMKAILVSDHDDIGSLLDLFKWGEYRMFSELITDQVLKCEEESEDKRLIRQKLGFFDFGDEAIEAIKQFAREKPNILKVFNEKLNRLLQTREINEYGELLGIQYLMISEYFGLSKEEFIPQEVIIEPTSDEIIIEDSDI
jgi:hypothetical protein